MYYLTRIGGFLVAVAAVTLSLIWAFGGFNSNTQNAYCVDQNGQVVAQQQCATPNPGLFLVITSHTYSQGQTVSEDETHIPADDPQARTNAGLPAEGEVPDHVQPPAEQAPVDNAPDNPGVHPAAPEVPAPAEHPVIINHPVVVDPVR